MHRSPALLLIFLLLNHTCPETYAFWLQMDEVLAGIVEKIKNFAIIYLV